MITQAAIAPIVSSSISSIVSIRPISIYPSTGSIPNIQSVSVNGLLLPVDGYIDIGLIDTMLDMLLETVGAIAACMIILLDKDRHPIIQNHTTL